jgi:hypothetical protein
MLKLALDQFADMTKGNVTFKFENGYTFSIAVGDGLYSHGDLDKGFSSVEIGVWDANGEWYCPWNPDDDVIGWQSVEEVLEKMNEVAAL